MYSSSTLSKDDKTYLQQALFQIYSKRYLSSVDIIISRKCLVPFFYQILYFDFAHIYLPILESYVI